MLYAMRRLQPIANALHTIALGCMMPGRDERHAGILVDFLNALNIPHENGVVEDLPKTVPDAALRAAVDTLLAKHPAEAVAVYLHAFNSMNAESWANLDALLKEEPRLRLERGA